MKIKIFGIDIDNYSLEEVVKKIIAHARYNKTPKYVVTPNVHHLVILQKDRDFQKVYQNAFLSVADGVPLLWVAKLQKTPLSGRVNGTDLFQKLCTAAAEQDLRVFLLGGRPGAAGQAAAILQQKNPGLKIAGTYCPPYGFEQDEAELTRINQKIKAAAPDILFVGLVAQKLEKWMAAYSQELGVPISLGIGVSFELVGGVVKRAPKWMQLAGLEWFYRLMVEPKRLFKRTVIFSVVFIWLLLKQQLGLSRLNIRLN
jgi:N-acetylglucosaminyldiphosphoundecaprenol N-acetyl-beta-D-mannosaminyltransferase